MIWLVKERSRIYLIWQIESGVTEQAQKWEVINVLDNFVGIFCFSILHKNGSFRGVANPFVW